VARIAAPASCRPIWLVVMLAVGLVQAQSPNPAFAPPPAAGGNANFFPGSPPQPGLSLGAAPPASQELFTPAETAARVGDEHIFRGDLLGDVNLMVVNLLVAAPPERRTAIRQQLETERPRLMKQLLTTAIERKLLYIEFLRGIPSGKLQEALASIDEKVGDHFNEGLFKMLDQTKTLPEDQYETLARQDARLFRLAYLMKQQDLTSLGQLEALLKENGSSLEMQRQAFAERVLGQQGLRDSIDTDPEVTHKEMLEYYKTHSEEFQVPAHARWEQITILFKNVPDKVKAGAMIAEIGNELVLGGAPFAKVAERKSHVNAKNGGQHEADWGDLHVSRVITNRVFGIELNRLSEIFEDNEGLHIIRVLERGVAHVTPFTAAQIGIEKSLKNEKRKKSLDKYLKEARERTQVWQEN
jgi:hypothetical protein